jgi:hypothetical protein
MSTVCDTRPTPRAVSEPPAVASGRASARPSAQRTQYDYPGEGGEQLLVSAQGDDRHGLHSLTLDYGYSVNLCRRAAEVEARELIYLFATLRVLWTR